MERRQLPRQLQQQQVVHVQDDNNNINIRNKKKNKNKKRKLKRGKKNDARLSNNNFDEVKMSPRVNINYNLADQLKEAILKDDFELIR